MDDLNNKLNAIDKLIKQCEQSRLVSFAYQDTMFSIQFSKVAKKAKQSIKDASEFKIDDLENKLDEYAITDNSQMDNQEKEDIVTIVSPFVGELEFSNQIKLGGNDIYINRGEVVCSIEAMKIYNDIKSTVSGTIIEILVKDCDLIEYEQPILKIRVDKNE